MNDHVLLLFSDLCKDMRFEQVQVRCRLATPDLHPANGMVQFRTWQELKVAVGTDQKQDYLSNPQHRSSLLGRPVMMSN